eukprot:7261866-Prorocentrum_lima.AAC.1
MTSSLVGSEMCIRDRLRGIAICDISGFWHSVRHLQLVHLLSQHEKPVSYTHLTLPTICSV